MMLSLAVLKVKLMMTTIYNDNDDGDVDDNDTGIMILVRMLVDLLATDINHNQNFFPSKIFI